MPKRRSNRSLIAACWCLLATTPVLGGCGGIRKLDEAAMHEGADLRLKLVRYHENRPLHFVGEIFRVQCASRNTAGSPGHDTQDPGWVALGRGAALGSGSAAEVAERERSNYIVGSYGVLVWIGNGVQVSFDGCGSFRAWYPTSLPRDMIVPVERPDHCAPKGSADCSGIDFMDARRPQFEEIQATAHGEVSFVARSEAFRASNGLRVWSTDSGRTWSVASR